MLCTYKSQEESQASHLDQNPMSNALPSGLGEKPWTFAWILARKVNRLTDAWYNFVHFTARKMGKNGEARAGSERTRIEYFLRDKDRGACGHRRTI